ncbi:hypothetical protein SAMN04487911_14411 [Arenibacter nanhaiticus]|uniref:DUF3324 domain-containing protein n=1 Tax=Arenibacter nanhaiticus TaxID=558155 RepID=A0A1M6MLY8_9FLAO|nr:hypothetical protein [Arenibacter nanhaiticus]SHJ84488.1 hypothetical protein SAMN04487911_14411 [Arenibacter nanhaiticus]
MKIRYFSFFICIFLSNLVFSNITVLNGLTHTYNGRSGQVISGEVILINSSSEEERVTFELNDAIFYCDAPRVFTNEETHNRSSNDWFKAELMDVVLNPKEKFVYRFTISIPHDQELRGSYWTVLMVNAEKPIKEEALTENIGLNTKMRYAVGLLTHVNDFDAVNLEFNDLQLGAKTADTNANLDITLQNHSLFIEEVLLSLEVYDQNGVKVYEGKSTRKKIFPGVCASFKLDISMVPEGDYECVLIADAREEYIGTNISLQL